MTHRSVYVLAYICTYTNRLVLVNISAENVSFWIIVNIFLSHILTCFQIYCKDMRKSNPVEYLSLPAGEEANFAEVYGER